MISLDEARIEVLKHTPTLSAECVELRNALGCILAQPIIALEDHPPFNSSAVDGYAVRSQDSTGATDVRPIKLSVRATVRAGEVGNVRIQPGTAVRIMTGAQLPDGADAVIMREHVQQSENEISVRLPVSVGENVRFAGEELKESEVVLEPGTHVTSSVVALLAALGYGVVEIYRRPWVSIITTGDELVAVNEILGAGKIRDSNAQFLRAALQELGIEEVEVAARIKDDKEQLESVIASALETADVVIITGGVSVGEFDLVKSVLSGLDVYERFWGIAVKPGKPTYFGTMGKTLVFGLPGNPVAVGVIFYELVRPALQAMMGRERLMLPQLHAVLEKSVCKKTSRAELLRGYVLNSNGVYSIAPLEKQGSHMLSGFAKANCLISFPKGKNAIEKGEYVEVHLLPWTDLQVLSGSTHGALQGSTAVTGVKDSFEKQGKILAISVSKRKGIPKGNVKSATLVKDWGIEGDVHAGKWHRQISFLAMESIKKMWAKGLKVRPGAFAENLTTEFIDVPNLRIGDRVRIGEAELEITQIGKECHTKCAIYYRAGDCVMPREGVFARVLQGGTIHVGDAVDVVPFENVSEHPIKGEKNLIEPVGANPSPLLNRD